MRCRGGLLLRWLLLCCATVDEVDVAGGEIQERLMTFSCFFKYPKA